MRKTKKRSDEAKDFSTPVKETKRSRDTKGNGSPTTPNKGLTAQRLTTEKIKDAFPILFGAAGELTKTQLEAKANKTVLQRMPGSNNTFNIQYCGLETRYLNLSGSANSGQEESCLQIWTDVDSLSVRGSDKKNARAFSGEPRESD